MIQAGIDADPENPEWSKADFTLALPAAELGIRPIKTEADYDRALTEIGQYFAHEPVVGTPEAARFKVLSMLIGAYEDRHWPIEV